MYKILLVDDEPWILRGLAKSFPWAVEGFEIAGAFTDPAKAVENALADPPDAMFVDIRMPGMDGLQLIQAIRDAGLTTQIVIISGYSEFEYARQALRMGAFEYCLKPLDEQTASTLLPRLRQRLDEVTALTKTIEPTPEPATNLDEPIEGEPTFAKLLRYLRANVERSPELAELSEMFHLNKSYLCELFKRHTGQTFSAYRNDLRIERAKALLKSTQLTIQEVSERSGCPDSFYFSKLFKRKLGVTPSMYRRHPDWTESDWSNNNDELAGGGV
ncbi:DNA-binding response regulator [Clostridia bacterium]|nr:DNA-binding response regulator [Clostridia bacterium]